jgi:hypothetical protein
MAARLKLSAPEVLNHHGRERGDEESSYGLDEKEPKISARAV